MTENFKQIFTHLRLPFSFFLLPVFVFSCSAVYPFTYSPIPLFFILHLLLYPASNGYNSYMDQDTESIGGIEHPAPVPKQMFWVSILLDAAGLIFAGLYYSWTLSALLLLYILASRAYSYRGIRLKKYAIIGYLTVVIFQGAFIFLLTQFALSGNFIFTPKLIIGVIISALLIGASYPLTQVYQHRQDQDDDVQTISMLLGIKGTFVFAAIMFLLFNLSCLYYFVMILDKWWLFGLLILVSAPSGYFLTHWAQKVWKDLTLANYKNSMMMSKIGSVSMNLFFLLLLCITVYSF